MELAIESQIYMRLNHSKVLIFYTPLNELIVQYDAYYQWQFCLFVYEGLVYDVGLRNL